MPKQPPALLVDGKPFIANPTPRTVERMSEFLNNLADNDVMTLAEFHKRSAIGKCALYDHFGHPKLATNVHVVGGKKKIYFGNPRGIEWLKRELATADSVGQP